MDPLTSSSFSTAYRYQFSTTTEADDVIGGRIGIYTMLDAGVEKDFWYICTSQTYSSTPAVDAVNLYRIVFLDNVYAASKLHTYDSWAQCGGTYAESETSAKFWIVEKGSESPYSP